MNNMPAKLRRDIEIDDAYRYCMRAGHFGHVCHGRVSTKEHVLTYAGKQVQIKAFVISLCAYGHSVDEFQDGGDLDKEINTWIALERATPSEMLALSKVMNYTREKVRLINKYGRWTQIYGIPTPFNPLGINY